LLLHLPTHWHLPGQPINNEIFKKLGKLRLFD
jgi:hypothetical protein